MMIDTLKVAEDLQAGGFSDEQSRALVHAISSKHDELATKADVTILRWLIGLLYPLVVAILISTIHLSRLR